VYKPIFVASIPHGNCRPAVYEHIIPSSVLVSFHPSYHDWMNARSPLRQELFIFTQISISYAPFFCRFVGEPSINLCSLCALRFDGDVSGVFSVSEENGGVKGVDDVQDALFEVALEVRPGVADVLADSAGCNARVGLGTILDGDFGSASIDLETRP
jgi:hypothetical protein